MHVIIDAGDLIAIIILLVIALFWCMSWFVCKIADWCEALWQKNAMERSEEHVAENEDTGTPEER